MTTDETCRIFDGSDTSTHWTPKTRLPTNARPSATSRPVAISAVSKCDRIFGDDGSDTSTDQSPHWREVTNAVFPETLSWRTYLGSAWEFFILAEPAASAAPARDTAIKAKTVLIAQKNTRRPIARQPKYRPEARKKIPCG